MVGMMQTRNTRHKNGLLREWRCCGNLWELLLTPQFPERYMWKPTCPICTLIKQAVKDGIFANYGEGKVCASVATQYREPSLKHLKMTVEVRKRGKSGLF